MKTPTLLMMCWIPICALGQASNMISVSTLQQESGLVTALTPADVEHLMKTAQTAEEFERLAAYFDQQAEKYAAKYEAERKELDRLFALRYHARSYAAQVENTQSRMEHFKVLFHKSSEQARLYRGRGKGDGTAAAPYAPTPD